MLKLHQFTYLMINLSLRTFVVLSLAPSLLQGHDSEAQLPFARTHAHDTLEAHFHTGWESRYFSEGRDSLDGDSLWATSIELAWDHLSGGVWYGFSPEQNYDELQVSFALSQSFNGIEFYVGYTYLNFIFDHSDDHEVGVGFSYGELPADLEFSADFYHSFDADGYFAECALAREISFGEKLLLNLSGFFGMNQGYVSDGHDGANHIGGRIGAEYALADNIFLAAHCAYSWALERDLARDGDELLKDFFHGGLGIQYSF